MAATKKANAPRAPAASKRTASSSGGNQRSGTGTKAAAGKTMDGAAATMTKRASNQMASPAAATKAKAATTRRQPAR